MTDKDRTTISKRDAHIGTNIPFRTQFHGDDPVTAGDVPVSGIMLGAEELNALLQEPHAHRALFAKRSGSTLDDPLFKGLAPFKLKDKIEAADVVLFVGANSEVKLGLCKLKNVTLEPKTGGLTELSCTIQSTPTLDKRIAVLLDHMDAGVQIEIGYEHNAHQPELPMGADAHPDPDAKNFEEAAKAQVAAFKRGRKSKGKGDRPGAH